MGEKFVPAGIDGIGEEDWIARYGDEPEFVRELLAAFLRDTDLRLPMVSGYCEANAEAYAGASEELSVGLDEILSIGLSVRAREIAEAAKDGDETYIGVHEQGFVEDMEKLCAEIRDALEE